MNVPRILEAAKQLESEAKIQEQKLQDEYVAKSKAETQAVLDNLPKERYWFGEIVPHYGFRIMGTLTGYASEEELRKECEFHFRKPVYYMDKSHINIIFKATIEKIERRDE